MIASFALEIGLMPRITLLKDHALCEVYLGQSSSVDKSHIQQIVREYMSARCQEFGLDYGQWPFSQGEFADGWRMEGSKVTKMNESSYSYYNFDLAGLQIIDVNNECWIVLDDCFAGVFVGDAHKHMEKGYLQPGAKNWVPEKLQGYHYPSKQLIESVRKRLFITKSVNTEQPPEPSHVIFRGGVTADGLQKFEVLSNEETQYVTAKEVEQKPLSKDLVQAIAEWLSPPPEEDLAVVSEEPLKDVETEGGEAEEAADLTESDAPKEASESQDPAPEPDPEAKRREK